MSFLVLESHTMHLLKSSRDEAMGGDGGGEVVTVGFLLGFYPAFWALDCMEEMWYNIKINGMW